MSDYFRRAGDWQSALNARPHRRYRVGSITTGIRHDARALLLVAVAAAALTGCHNDSAPAEPQFADISGQLPIDVAALGLPGALTGFGPLWLDIDGDGQLDLVYMNHGQMPTILENSGRKDGGPAFINRSAAAGLKSSDWEYRQQNDRHGASCGDFDNDGDVDLFIGHGAARGETLGLKRDELLENIGDFRFRDVTRAAASLNEAGRGRAASWADYDGDGWLDLYVTNLDSPNRMYRNNGDGRFSDTTESIGLAQAGPRAAWIDFDGDGDADVAVSWPLKLMRNDGEDGFVDVTKAVGLDRPAVSVPYALAWQDFDNDGDPDLFVSGRNSPGRLMVNDGGRFKVFDPDFVWSDGPELDSNGAVWGDFDNDGFADLLLTHSRGLALFRNVASRRFERVPFAESDRLDLAYSGQAAAGDVDDDGFLDVAVNTVDDHRLYKNRGGENAWLVVEFDGSMSNRMGFGVKLKAEAILPDGRRLVQHRQYFGDNGAFRSIGCGPLDLGLAGAERVDLTLTWPSGVEQRLENVAVNRKLKIREPAFARLRAMIDG
ncbi:MAG: CRTAC1 family protein [Wenzhouxiangellaceae bacterium]|nr:CRTAC1 family protein [Wenzhouxiangellaceae bacterium]